MTLYGCDVLPRDALVVSWGINDGEILGAVSACVLGDVYTLRPDATAYHLTLGLGDSIILAQADPRLQPALRLDATVSLEGTIRLMANDGEVVELIALESCGQSFVLPLSPLRQGVGYALIETSLDDVALQLTQTVHGCFATGTRITLSDGRLVPIETLAPGVEVLTRDNGAQPLRWVGEVSLRGHGQFAPVVFPPGVLGNLATLVVAPRQQIFLYQRGDQRLADRAEILIQAQFLVGSGGVHQRETGYVTYHALVFDDQQIIYAEGAPMESLLVSRATLARLPATLQADLEHRFPNLNQRAHFARSMTRTDITAHTTSILRTR